MQLFKTFFHPRTKKLNSKSFSMESGKAHGKKSMKSSNLRTCRAEEQENPVKCRFKFVVGVKRSNIADRESIPPRLLSLSTLLFTIRFSDSASFRSYTFSSARSGPSPHSHKILFIYPTGLAVMQR
jgi:hypothetical protein